MFFGIERKSEDKKKEKNFEIIDLKKKKFEWLAAVSFTHQTGSGWHGTVSLSAVDEAFP